MFSNNDIFVKICNYIYSINLSTLEKINTDIGYLNENIISKLTRFNNASITRICYKGKTILHIAIVKHWNLAVYNLIYNIKDIWPQSSRGKPLLHLAVQYKNYYALKLLLNNDYKITTTDNSDLDAICYAIALQDKKAFDLLLPYIKLPMLKNYLLFAVSIGNHYFIDKLININIVNDIDILLCALHKDQSLIQHLINKGFDISVKDANGLTLLHYATKYNKYIKYLSTVIDVNAVDNNGWSPLHYTIVNNNISDSLLLIKMGADINIIDNYGKTAIHYASIKGYKEILTILLQYNASVHIRDRYNKTAYEYAKLLKNIVTQKLLEQQYKPYSNRSIGCKTHRSKNMYTKYTESSNSLGCHGYY